MISNPIPRASQTGSDIINGLGILLAIVVVATPIAWFLSEFQNRRWLRLILGSTAVLLSFGVAFLAGSLQMFNANAWFGAASETLINTTITELEAGNQDRVLKSLKSLQQKFSPTYENRAGY